jgi:hypothetical protein
MLVYQTDDDPQEFRTRFFSDKDAQEIGEAMSDSKVDNCWMFNAAGEPISSNPLGDPGEKVLTENKNAGMNLEICLFLMVKFFGRKSTSS